MTATTDEDAVRRTSDEEEEAIACPPQARTASFSAGRRDWLKAKLRPEYERLLDELLAETDFPWLPEWLADPICKQVALYGYDRLADRLLAALLGLLDALGFLVDLKERSDG